eukprot:TRINITY_DN16215_c0_g1_i1.p1 TRINITY_DN16215_c0_g1~~TRINITY_DN16215_c0_g1_i1.p1  ORF type:complete len:110 (+),score=31.31 TRINITY_DN16215_c0_g1_i1:52-381(+)
MASWVVKKVVSDKLSQVNPFEDKEKKGMFSSIMEEDKTKTEENTSKSSFWNSEEREKKALEKRKKERKEEGDKKRDKYRKKYHIGEKDKAPYVSLEPEQKKSCCSCSVL